MDKAEKNRQFILGFYKTISGRIKTRELLTCFTSDPELIERVLLYERLFPKYELILDEITCENDRVIVRARVRGEHIGATEGFAPTYRLVEMPLVIGYRVSRGRIFDHWVISNQLELLEQLGF